ncbi:MAG: His-Xaa-Ser system radical SAM maturase HxsB, partial [Clostridia bacterium]
MRRLSMPRGVRRLLFDDDPYARHRSYAAMRGVRTMKLNRQFFLWEQKGDQYLLTNDMGRFCFVSPCVFERLMKDEIVSEDPCAQALSDNGFVSGDEAQFLGRWSDELAQMKSCHFCATQLFILVLTDACNQRCVYCQAGSAHRSTAFMSKDTAQKAIRIAAQSPADHVTIEFQGGEPTLNQVVLKDAVPYARDLFDFLGKRVDFAIATNLTTGDTDIIDWLVAQNVHISTSLDGPARLHDANRPLADGAGSFERFREGADAYRKACVRHGFAGQLGAIETTTRESLQYAEEIVDAYISQGMSRLYLRPLTPLGCAKERWGEIGYTAEAYLAFYRRALNHILAHCMNGQPVSEMTAALYLRRILCCQGVGHTEFRSPCGGGIGQMAVNYDGKIYPCDEARMLANMKDDAFLLGTVENRYQELICSPVVHVLSTSSCIEGLPMCCDCVYSPYCAVCPVVTYGLAGDIITHEIQSSHCKIAKGI